jgi:hypothetical protein
MIVRCEKCETVYEDEHWLTYCPHNGIDGVCREHDLYNCPFHDEVKDGKDETPASDTPTGN